MLEVSDSVLGILLATVGAAGFAGQFLCIRLGTDDGEVTDAVLVVLLCNVALVVPPVLVLYSPPYTDLFTPRSFVSFAAAGVAGMFVARLLMFKSIEEIGANLTSPVIASNVLFATVFAVLLLEERLTAAHFAGVVLIVAGLAVVSWETAAATGPEESIRETGATLVLPLVAAVCIGIEPIFISTGLAEGTAILPGIVVMAGVATIGFVGYLAWTRSLRRIPVRTASTAWYVAGGISTTVGFVAYFAALEIAPVVLVMPLLQLTPLLVVVCSVLFLPRRLERVTWRVGASAFVVVIGATLVSLSG
ncbi:EamA family transporter [Natronorubrum sp. JWXQ-INN-674]|uniref:EamA family transporter n=1 Tax=Natronorubrum halalkaliphilum TaxID=2691917 RepID=A0A6B0VPW3_9EURY|nr:DMT family transporter [Natronorubrum halalkaliphilum]MXV63538.1 EamA family transporter [Natronorubrum halalkaliphilum]